MNWENTPFDYSALNTRRRKVGDAALFLGGIAIVIVAFFTDAFGYTVELLPRMGAIFVLCCALLEFRTHEIEMMRSKDNLVATWRMISTLTEGLVSVDRVAKSCAKQLATVIAAAGEESPWGKPEDIKTMVMTERLKALQSLPSVPDSFYRYSRAISVAGKVGVVCGTLIWAFGDLVSAHAS